MTTINTTENEIKNTPLARKPFVQPKILTDSEKLLVIQRIKSGDSPVNLGKCIFRMNNFVNCKNYDEEIVLFTKLDSFSLYRNRDSKDVSRLYNHIVKLFEAIENEDYESFKMIQSWISKYQKTY